MTSGIIYAYGNCQVKQIALYLQYIPQVVARYPTILYFYVLDDVAKLDRKKLAQAEVFIYQHTSLDALRGQEDLKPISTSDYITNSLLPKDCLAISIPSVYSSILFPNAMSTNEARQGFPDHVPPEVFPNYAFSRRLHHMLLQKADTHTIKSTMCDENAYSTVELQKNEVQNFENLRARETKNQVTIPLAEFIRSNFRQKRLLLTTNHPTKYLFDHLLNEILQRMQMPPSTIALDMDDQLEKLGKLPILPCVTKAFGLDVSHPSYADQQIWVDNVELPTYHAYVQYLKELL